VEKWENNKLDRTKSSRMGWSDLSICLRGPVVEDLKAHFVARWNFIYYEKYDVQKDDRYHPLKLLTTQIPDGYYHSDGKPVHKIIGDINPEDEDAPGSHQHLFHLPGSAGTMFNRFREKLNEERSRGGPVGHGEREPEGISIQLVRSCTRWSNGVATEVSPLHVLRVHV
jgi:phospholipase D1/2